MSPIGAAAMSHSWECNQHVHRSAIEKLRAQNEQLKQELLLENKFSLRPGDAYSQSLINSLQDEGDNLARKVSPSWCAVARKCSGLPACSAVARTSIVTPKGCDALPTAALCSCMHHISTLMRYHRLCWKSERPRCWTSSSRMSMMPWAPRATSWGESTQPRSRVWQSRYEWFRGLVNQSS